MPGSTKLFEEAKKVLVGGVNSPVRAFNAVEGDPIFMKAGSGASLMAEEGQELLDYVLSWGPLILGHAPPLVVDAIQKAAARGTSFGAPTVLETELAHQVIRFYPHIQKLRFVNSGTEACMSAIRLARGVTGKPKIIKFEGCYHGHSDSLLVSAGSGGLTMGQPDSAGVLPAVANDTLVLPYNDQVALAAVFREAGSDIAGIIVEPIAGNMGVVPPEPGFLEACRSLASGNGALLIFDEVMCGFRTTKGTASDETGILPDITCLGKVIGGGLPCGAYGASDSIMNHISPVGGVYQAGTLSGNPLAMVAGIETLKQLNSTVFNELDMMTKALVEGLSTVFQRAGVPATLSQSGSMFSIFLTDLHQVRNLSEVKTTDVQKFRQIHSSLLSEGIYLAPSAYESNFLSICHGKAEIEQTIRAVEKTCQK